MTESGSRQDADDKTGDPKDQLAFGGPTASSWREQALTRVAELEYLSDAFVDEEKLDRDALRNGMQQHLDTGPQGGRREGAAVVAAHQPRAVVPTATVVRRAADQPAGNGQAGPAPQTRPVS